MASMNISLPEPMRDYVQSRVDAGQYASASDYFRDLIRRDQGAIVNEERWLRDLDESIAAGFAEFEAGGGIELEEACEILLADLKANSDQDRA